MHDRIIKILFPLIAVALVFSFVQKSKKEFSFTTVYSPLPFHEEWRCTSTHSPQYIDSLLSQRFHYLASGAQMLAFLGDDGKTVLKLFRMKHLLPKKWVTFVPVSKAYRQRKTEMRAKKLSKTFQSVKIAAETLPKETGVIFAHLNPGFEKKVVVADKHNNLHLIDLAHSPFVLQEKAELIYTRFVRHLKCGDINHFVEDLGKILALIAKRCFKGIKDGDSGVSANYGFVEDRAVQIDIGELSFQEMPVEEISKEVNRVNAKINLYIRKQGLSLRGTSSK